MPLGSRYLTGHTELDRQHLHIMTLIDTMRDHDTQVSIANTQATLALINAISEHFQYEERLMRMYNFPDAATHLHEHASISSWIDRLRLDIASETIDHDVLQEFFRYWAKHHIGRSDKRLGAFLAGRT